MSHVDTLLIIKYNYDNMLELNFNQTIFEN
jgi:hypothetical protein